MKRNERNEMTEWTLIRRNEQMIGINGWMDDMNECNEKIIDWINKQVNEWTQEFNQMKLHEAKW